MNYLKEFYSWLKEFIEDPLRKGDLEAFVRKGNPKTPADVARLEAEFNRYWGNANRSHWDL